MEQARLLSYILFRSHANRRDDDTWLTWLSPLPRLTGSSALGSIGRAERANYSMFLNELCDLFDVPRPDPARSGRREECLRLRAAQSHSRTRTARRRSSGSTSTSAIASCSRPSRAAIGSKPPSLSRCRRIGGCAGDGRPGHGGLGCGNVRGEGASRALRAQPAGLRA